MAGVKAGLFFVVIFKNALPSGTWSNLLGHSLQSHKALGFALRFIVGRETQFDQNPDSALF